MRKATGVAKMPYSLESLKPGWSTTGNSTPDAAALRRFSAGSPRLIRRQRVRFPDARVRAEPRSGRRTSHGPHSGSLKTSSTRRPRRSASETSATREVGKLERRRGDTRLQPLPLDQTLGERALARQALAAAGGFLYELGNLARADSDRLRDPVPVVEEIADRCAHMCKPFDGLAVALKKDGTVKAMCL